MAKARIQYSPETKAKIIEAVVEARKTGSWRDAHAAAEKIGYKGNAESLMQMMADVRRAAQKADSAKRIALAKKTVPAPAALPVAKTAAPRAAKPAPKKRKHKAKKRNYDATTKAAIVKAALAARNAGKKWPEALVAAKAAGYQGGQISLGLFVKAARKPGRPAKAVAPAAKKRGRPAKVTAAAPALDPVAAQYLASAIDNAIGELQKLRQQYAG